MKKKTAITISVAVFIVAVMMWLTVGVPVPRIVEINATTLEQNCVFFDRVERMCVDGIGAIDAIEDFTYDPNYTYNILVFVRKAKFVPLDVNPFTVRMLKILSKEPEKRNSLGYFPDEGIYYAKGTIDENTYNRCINSDKTRNCTLSYFATNNPASNFEIVGNVPFNYISGFSYEPDTDYDFAFVRTRSDTFALSGNDANSLWYKYELYVK